jgi:hypothetical protein
VKRRPPVAGAACAWPTASKSWAGIQRKADKLGERLLESDDGKQWLKPKGMHWRTFDALVDRANAAAAVADHALRLSLAPFLLRHGFPGTK